MSRHAVPFADTQYLSRTHSVFRGHTVSFAPTAGTTRAGGWKFCFLARTRSVFRAYGEDYMGRRLGILLSCPDTQCLSRLRRGLHGQAGNFERKELSVIWADRPLFR